MIRACSVCGATKLRMPGFQDGSIPETDNLQTWICEAGHNMTPLEFDEQAAYEAFVQGLDS